MRSFGEEVTETAVWCPPRRSVRLLTACGRSPQAEVRLYFPFFCSVEKRVVQMRLGTGTNKQITKAGPKQGKTKARRVTSQWI